MCSDSSFVLAVYSGDSPDYNDCLSKCLAYIDPNNPLDECLYFTHGGMHGGTCYLYSSCPGLSSVNTCLSGEWFNLKFALISWLEIGIFSFDLTGQWLVNDWSKYLAGQKWSKVVFCKKFFKWLFLVLGVICGCQKEVCIPQNNTFFGLNEENYWQLSSFAHLPPWKYLILVVFTNNSLTSQKGFAQSISQHFWLVNWPVSRSKFRSLRKM